MDIYPYQQECLDAIESARQAGRNKALVVMATGLGKTVVSALKLKQLLAEVPGRALYVTHQNEILRQARHTYEYILPAETTYGYFTGEEKHLHKVDVLFASFQTMTKSRELFTRDEFRYVVVDEAHHVYAETYRPTVEYFTPDLMIGLTATPDRADEQDITELMGDPVFHLDLFEALANRYLTPVNYRLMTDELQNLGILDTPAGKLSIAELNRTIFIPRRDEEIVRIIEEKMREIKSPRTIIFCSTVAHAEQLAKLMPHSQVVHSRLTKDQKSERTNAFRSGHSHVVITVDMFNEGIDVPEANVIVFLRSTSSRTIYLQQLGRGLRRAEGKDEMFVLDFVSNCERIEMVDFVSQGVKEASKRISSRNDKSDIESKQKEIFTLSIDGSEFDERLVNLADIVARTRQGYTKDDLVRQIKVIALEIDGIPSIANLKSSDDCADIGTFINYFGSWNNALRAAGFTPPREVRNYTRSELVEQIRKMHREIGRTPHFADVDHYCEASRMAFTVNFGSWNKALQEAGLRPNRGLIYSREELIQQLHIMNSELGRVPKQSDIKSIPNFSEVHFRREFGSWTKALEAAGLLANVRNYSRQELIGQIQQLYSELGRVPVMSDLSGRDNVASATVFSKRFGSWVGALKAAGHQPATKQGVSRKT